MYDITFLGNAPVDVLMTVPDGVLEQHNLQKGDFINVSAETLEAVLATVPKKDRQIMPGGSCANTAHGFANLGGKASICAYVGDDKEGLIFYDSMKKAGIDMPAPVTGKRSLVIYVLITPDGERTFIHASAAEGLPPRATIGSEGLMKEAIQASKWLYIEGYLFAEDFPAIVKACSIARQNNTKIALTLAASSFVEGFYNEIAMLVRDGIDLYICNEEELATLKAAELKGEDAQHTEETLSKLRSVPHLVTCGKDGATYQDPNETTQVATQPAEDIVDATGAGDAFAAGYFYGFLNNQSREDAIMLGHKMAGKVIQQVGGRLPDIAF